MDSYGPMVSRMEKARFPMRTIGVSHPFDPSREPYFDVYDAVNASEEGHEVTSSTLALRALGSLIKATKSNTLKPPLTPEHFARVEGAREFYVSLVDLEGEPDPNKASDAASVLRDVLDHATSEDPQLASLVAIDQKTIKQ